MSIKSGDLSQINLLWKRYFFATQYLLRSLFPCIIICSYSIKWVDVAWKVQNKIEASNQFLQKKSPAIEIQFNNGDVQLLWVDNKKKAKKKRLCRLPENLRIFVWKSVTYLWLLEHEVRFFSSSFQLRFMFCWRIKWFKKEKKGC